MDEKITLKELEKRLTEEFRKQLKKPTNEEIENIKQRIDKFLRENECGLIIFSKLDKELKPTNEYALLRISYEKLKETLLLYINELEPFKRALEEIREKEKENEQINKMIR